MSRSYKHRKSAVVHFKERNSKFGKRQASAAVRRAADVPNGKQWNMQISIGIYKKNTKAYSYLFQWTDLCSYLNCLWISNANTFKQKNENKEEN